MPRKYLAHNGQSWWNAVCNCNTKIKRPLESEYVLSDSQYLTYKEMLRDSIIVEDKIFSFEPLDIQFLFLCFMAAIHGEN